MSSKGVRGRNFSLNCWHGPRSSNRFPRRHHQTRQNPFGKKGAINDDSRWKASKDRTEEYRKAVWKNLGENAFPAPPPNVWCASIRVFVWLMVVPLSRAWRELKDSRSRLDYRSEVASRRDFVESNTSTRESEQSLTRSYYKHQKTECGVSSGILATIHTFVTSVGTKLNRWDVGAAVSERMFGDVKQAWWTSGFERASVRREI